jgi:hypothetical protein
MRKKSTGSHRIVFTNKAFPAHLLSCFFVIMEPLSVYFFDLILELLDASFIRKPIDSQWVLVENLPTIPA